MITSREPWWHAEQPRGRLLDHVVKDGPDGLFVVHAVVTRYVLEHDRGEQRHRGESADGAVGHGRTVRLDTGPDSLGVQGE